MVEVMLPSTLDKILVVIAGFFSASLGIYALTRSLGSSSHRFFAGGMILLMTETILGGVALIGGTPESQLFWYRIRAAVSSVIPGTWFLFALTFGEGNLRQRLERWKWPIGAVFTIPILFGVFFSKNLYYGIYAITASGKGLLRLGWSGYVFNLAFILAVVLVMVLMENTLRSSKGIKRWQVKFLILGILGYFSVRIYSCSQAILFRALDPAIEITFAATALIMADFLITMTFLRSKELPADIYLSKEFIQRSIMLLLVGGYLLAAGLLAKVLTVLGGPLPYQLLNFLVFTALLFLAAILLSDRLRFTFKNLVSRHFQRPRYDYRDTWMKFTKRTATSADFRDLGNRTASLISEMLEVLSVGIWLFGDRKQDLRLSGSTSQSSPLPAGDLPAEEVESLKELLAVRRTPFDIHDETDPVLREYGIIHAGLLQAIGMRYCVPLLAGEELLGFIALDERVLGEPLGLEEMDLLGTIGAQAAAGIYSMILFEKLQELREMEALRRFSAFFVHDLKNLASKLSMMLQNFPDHYDNPDFRADALNLIAQSVEKINGMTHRVSELREEPETGSGGGDLSEVVRSALSDFDPPSGVSIVEEYEEAPCPALNVSQISKVVTNLVLNALESVGEKGRICVRTYEENGWSVFEVDDDGPGMDGEFINRSLFRPFKTTKEKGLGIGLYQCRSIVEAHGGRIEALSKLGEGATFRVSIPGPGESGSG